MDFLNRPASHQRTSAWLCGLIACLREPNILNACSAYLVPEIGHTGTLNVKEASPGCPAYVVATFDDRILVAIDGATTLEQCQFLINAYSGTITNGFNDPNNGYLEGAADSILRQINAWGLGAFQNWTIAGYSLGGAIAPMLRVNLAVKEWLGSSIETVSFGAPRPCGVSQRRYINANMNLTRWMSPRDPIPLVPLHVLDFPALPGIIGIRPALRWGNFCHPAGGIEVDPLGAMVPLVVPSEASCNMVLSLASWFFQEENDPINAHALINYKRSLENGDRRNVNTHTQRMAPAEVPQDIPRVQMNEAERRAADQLVIMARNQLAVPVNIPRVDRFKHEKLGRVHYVTFRGKVMVTHPSKKKCQAIARTMNDMLKRLQTAALVDDTALKDTFSAYIDEATDPAGEFSPVMNTSWNAGNV